MARAASQFPAGALTGRTIAFLEARRSMELEQLIERQGGKCFKAPALRETPRVDAPDVREWVGQLASGAFDIVVFLSGVGCQLLLEQAERDSLLPSVYASLAKARVVARGPKPVHVLKQHRIRIHYVPP